MSAEADKYLHACDKLKQLEDEFSEAAAGYLAGKRYLWVLVRLRDSVNVAHKEKMQAQVDLIVEQKEQGA